MDPNATAQQIQDFLAAGNHGDEVDEWARSLMTWIRNGGFAPTWSGRELALSYYLTRCVAENFRDAEASAKYSAYRKSIGSPVKGYGSCGYNEAEQDRSAADDWDRGINYSA